MWDRSPGFPGRSRRLCSRHRRGPPGLPTSSAPAHKPGNSLDPACRSGGRAEGEDAARHPCQAQSSLTCSRGARYAVGEPSRHPVLVLSRAAHSSARSWRGAGGERLVSLLCHLDRKPSAHTLFIIILVLKIVAKHTWQFPVSAASRSEPRAGVSRSLGAPCGLGNVEAAASKRSCHRDLLGARRSPSPSLQWGGAGGHFHAIGFWF